MRGLLIALLAFDFPGHCARGDVARLRFTKITANKTTVTTV